MYIENLFKEIRGHVECDYELFESNFLELFDKLDTKTQAVIRVRYSNMDADAYRNEIMSMGIHILSTRNMVDKFVDELKESIMPYSSLELKNNLSVLTRYGISPHYIARVQTMMNVHTIGDFLYKFNYDTKRYMMGNSIYSDCVLKELIKAGKWEIFYNGFSFYDKEFPYNLYFDIFSRDINKIISIGNGDYMALLNNAISNVLFGEESKILLLKYKHKNTNEQICKIANLSNNRSVDASIRKSLYKLYRELAK